MKSAICSEMACNAWAYKGVSGKYQGIPANYLSGDKLGPAEPVRALLTTAVKGSLIGRKDEDICALAS